MNAVVDALATELDACHLLAPKSAFILGFARSSTTILTEIINSAGNALMLAEANFYQPLSAPRFRDWYVAMHREFENQVAKSSYAPDFIARESHAWWQWLRAASVHYHLVGDKMAFSAQHFRSLAPEHIQAFFEARFFQSRYIFTIRHPGQTLASVAHLFSINDPERLQAEVCAWLKFIQLWADWIRIFPYTFTIIADDLGPSTIKPLGDFLGLDLSGSEVLLNPAEKRVHPDMSDILGLAPWAADLEAIFADVRRCLALHPRIWQAGQKRQLALNDTRTDPTAGISNAPHSLGQAWACAESLIQKLEMVKLGSLADR